MNLARLDLLAGDLLDVLWRVSWQAAVLAGMVLIVQWLLRDRLSARWRYNLWLLVLLRLVVPVTPQTSFSIFNLSDRLITVAKTSEATALPSTPLAVSQVSKPRDVIDAPPVAGSAKTEATATVIPRSSRAPVPWRLILASAWITGCLILLARIAYATARLSRVVRKMTTVDAPHITQLLARCCDDLGVRRRVVVLASADLPAPALMGVLRPKLLLPRHVLDTFAPDELRLILLHELGHLKRNDVLVNWAVSLLHALHWFNPVLWLAFARLRADRELATDELVLSLTGDSEKSAYGATIIKLLQSFAHTHPRRPAPLAGAVGILERAHLLRRRITMIAQFRHHARKWTALAAGCMLALAALGLTDAVRGDDATHAAAAPAGPAVAARAAPAEPADAADQAQSPAGDRAAAASTAAALRKLAEVAPEASFEAIPFADVVDFLRDVTKLNFFVDWRALESAGIERNTPVTVRLKDVSFEQVLRYVLRDVGGGEVKLDFAVTDGIVNIATEEHLATDVKVRVYDVSSLLKSMATTAPADQAIAQHKKVESIVQIISETVDPESWRDAGGAVGSIREINGRLVIAQTEANHAQIAKLLDEISDGGDEAVNARK